MHILEHRTSRYFHFLPADENDVVAVDAIIPSAVGLLTRHVHLLEVGADERSVISMVTFVIDEVVQAESRRPTRRHRGRVANILHWFIQARRLAALAFVCDALPLRQPNEGESIVQRRKFLIC